MVWTILGGLLVFIGVAAATRWAASPQAQPGARLAGVLKGVGLAIVGSWVVLLAGVREPTPIIAAYAVGVVAGILVGVVAARALRPPA